MEEIKRRYDELVSKIYDLWLSGKISEENRDLLIFEANQLFSYELKKRYKSETMLRVLAQILGIVMGVLNVLLIMYLIKKGEKIE